MSELYGRARIAVSQLQSHEALAGVAAAMAEHPLLRTCSTVQLVEEGLDLMKQEVIQFLKEDKEASA